MKIADILIGERHRRDLGDIAELAASIQTEGLLQPVGITPQNELVFGYRRLVACRDHLKLDDIEVRVVNVTSIVAGEYTENEMRKDFTVSERVAILKTMERRPRGRPKNNSKNFSNYLSSEEAAMHAGFGNRITARQAETVVECGVPELIEAMDSGAMKISAAAKVAKLPPEEQRDLIAAPKKKNRSSSDREGVWKNGDSMTALACDALLPLVQSGQSINREKLAAEIGCGVATIQRAHLIVMGHLHGLPGQPPAKPERRKRIDPPMLSLTLPSSEELGAPPPGASWTERNAWRDKIGAKVPLHPMRIKQLQNDEVKVDQIAFVVRRLVQDGTPTADEFMACVDRMLAHVHLPEANEPGDRIDYAKMAREARRMIESSIEAAIEKLQGYRAIVRKIRAVS